MTALLEVMTHTGTSLAIDLPTRWMLHTAPHHRTPDQARVMLFRPKAHPRIAVMMADDADPELIYPPQGNLRAMLVLNLAQDADSGFCDFVHPLSHRSAVPLELSGTSHHGSIGEDVGMAGRFKVRPVLGVHIRTATLALAAALERVFAAATLPAGLAECLRTEQTSVVRHVFRAMSYALTRMGFADLSARLLQDGALLDRLMVAMPDDVWVVQGLGGLARHQRPMASQTAASRGAERTRGRGLLSFRRNPAPVPPPPAVGGSRAGGQNPFTDVLPVEYGYLATAGLYGTTESFGHTCNAAARAHTRPAKRACVLAAARNEGLTLEEWIAYHRSLGFDDIFLYSNTNNDGSDGLLQALAGAGVIHYTNNEAADGFSAQQKAYGHALSLRPEIVDYAWMLLIDLDEFFVFNPDLFGSVNDYLSWQEDRDVDAIALNWVMMGSQDDPRRHDAPVTRRFRRMLHGADTHVKSLFRPQKFVHSGAHFPHAHELASFVFRDAAGRPHRYDRATQWRDAPAQSLQPDATYACVNHYFFKSADEYLWKFARNRGDGLFQAGLSMAAITPHFIASFIGQARLAPVRQTDWAVRCAPNLEADMQRLLALPGVQEAQQAVYDVYNARIGQVRELFRTSDALRDAGAAGADLLRLLDEGVL